MCSSSRGRAVIISNENFADQIPDRDGSAIDLRNLSELFTQLGFETFTHTDRTAPVSIIVLIFFKQITSHEVNEITS